MPRIARFTTEDGIYHILSRGNNKQNVFHNDEDRATFKDLLICYAKKFGIEIYHYVLMSNHIHLVVKAGNGDKLARFMIGGKICLIEFLLMGIFVMVNLV